MRRDHVAWDRTAVGPNIGDAVLPVAFGGPIRASGKLHTTDYLRLIGVAELPPLTSPLVVLQKNNSVGETEPTANVVGRLFSFQSEDFRMN